MRMVILRKRSIKDCHNRITYERRDRALFIPDLFNHNFEIVVEQIHDLFWRNTFAQTRIAANIGEDNGNFACLPTKIKCHRVFDKLLYHVRVHILLENFAYLRCLRLRTF